MKPSNLICPFCSKPNVWYLEKDERGNKNNLYCRDCYMRFTIEDVTAVETDNISESNQDKSNGYATKKNWLAVQALDLFTKIFCIKENEEDLEFECENCEFQNSDGTCSVKKFAGKHCPEYRNFGSMGEL